MKELNPFWEATASGHAPDGDTFLSDDEVKDFAVPTCVNCGGILSLMLYFLVTQYLNQWCHLFKNDYRNLIQF